MRSLTSPREVRRQHGLSAIPSLYVLCFCFYAANQARPQKNVYSVFRYNPPSVGFAELSDTALALNGADGPVPSATIGSAAATLSATSTGKSRSPATQNISPASTIATAVVLLTTFIAGLLL